MSIVFKADYRYLLWPISLQYEKNVRLLCIDYHCEYVTSNDMLNDRCKFKPILKVKKTLFADILQKYSSNKARLGLSDLHPTFNENKAK